MLLGAIGGSRGCLLLEDLHWADGATVALVAHLAGVVAGTREQVETATAAHLLTVEDKLVVDGTCYVVELDGVVVGGSGVDAQRRARPAPSGPRPTPPTTTAWPPCGPPTWTPTGLATALARTTEAAATLAGFRCFEALCPPATRRCA